MKSVSRRGFNRRLVRSCLGLWATVGLTAQAAVPRPAQTLKPLKPRAALSRRRIARARRRPQEPRQRFGDIGGRHRIAIWGRRRELQARTRETDSALLLCRAGTSCRALTARDFRLGYAQRVLAGQFSAAEIEQMRRLAVAGGAVG